MADEIFDQSNEIGAYGNGVTEPFRGLFNEDGFFVLYNDYCKDKKFTINDEEFLIQGYSEIVTPFTEDIVIKSLYLTRATDFYIHNDGPDDLYFFIKGNRIQVEPEQDFKGDFTKFTSIVVKVKKGSKFKCHAEC